MPSRKIGDNMTAEKEMRLSDCAKIQAERIAATAAAHQAIREHSIKQLKPESEPKKEQAEQAEFETKAEPEAETEVEPKADSFELPPASEPIKIPRPRKSCASNKFGG